MLHYLKILLHRLALCSLASVVFISILAQVHDYSQTRQALHDYIKGDGLMWVIAFYFLNEASSGVKYAFTGNDEHLGYFPRSDIDTSASNPRRSFRLTLLTVSRDKDDWVEQLRISHLYALGWGTEADPATAAEWYLVSEKTARRQGQHENWLSFNFRERVRVVIDNEIIMERLSRELPEMYQQTQ